MLALLLARLLSVAEPIHRLRSYCVLSVIMRGSKGTVDLGKISLPSFSFTEMSDKFMEQGTVIGISLTLSTLLVLGSGTAGSITGWIAAVASTSSLSSIASIGKGTRRFCVASRSSTLVLGIGGIDTKPSSSITLLVVAGGAPSLSVTVSSFIMFWFLDSVSKVFSVMFVSGPSFDSSLGINCTSPIGSSLFH